MSSLQEALYWDVGFGWHIRHTAIEIFKVEEDGTVSIRSVSGSNYELTGETAESFIEMMNL